MTAPIYADSREKAVAKQRAYDRKLFANACNQLAAHMDGLGLIELYRSEVTKEISQPWARAWDSLNQDRTKETVEFKIKGVTYWLTRDF
jgi:hypothetical protein